MKKCINLGSKLSWGWVFTCTWGILVTVGPSYFFSEYTMWKNTNTGPVNHRNKQYTYWKHLSNHVYMWHTSTPYLIRVLATPYPMGWHGIFGSIVFGSLSFSLYAVSIDNKKYSNICSDFLNRILTWLVLIWNHFFYFRKILTH